MDYKQIIRDIFDAIEENEAEKVLYLFDLCPESLNEITPFGTWLHVAASEGQTEIVKKLIDLGLDVNKKGGTYLGGSLNEATTEGHYNTAVYLLSRGAELDTSDSRSNPLFGAILSGNKDIVKLLLDSGIDASVRYTGDYMQNMDAYDFAIERGQTEIAEMLLPYRK